MKSVSPGDDFYRAPVTLIVEDPTTQVFLEEIWQQDPKINLRVGAGHEGVSALVKGAPERAELLVVGMVDRDLGTKNSDRWENPETRIFKLDRHEIENYFLDWSILESLSRNRLSAADIEAGARAFAGKIVWWMACKNVIRKIRADLMSDFPPEPSLPPREDARDEAEAAGYLCGQPFWKNQPRELKKWGEGHIKTMVSEEGKRYQQDLSGGVWLETFSGKEIFRHLRELAKLDPDTQKQATPAQRDEDLGRKIAGKMRQRGLAPPDLVRLHGVIRKRAGLPPLRR